MAHYQKQQWVLDYQTPGFILALRKIDLEEHKGIRQIIVAFFSRKMALRELLKFTTTGFKDVSFFLLRRVQGVTFRLLIGSINIKIVKEYDTLAKEFFELRSRHDKAIPGQLYTRDHASIILHKQTAWLRSLPYYQCIVTDL